MFLLEQCRSASFQFLIKCGRRSRHCHVEQVRILKEPFPDLAFGHFKVVILLFLSFGSKRLLSLSFSVFFLFIFPLDSFSFGPLAFLPLLLFSFELFPFDPFELLFAYLCKCFGFLLFFLFSFLLPFFLSLRLLSCFLLSPLFFLLVF